MPQGSQPRWFGRWLWCAMIDYYTHRRMMLIRGRLPASGLTLNIGSAQNPYISSSVGKVINIDIEPACMPNFLRGRAEHLPFRGGVFDNVVFFDVLEHIPDDRAAVREAWRVLNAGGRLYATIPCREDDFFMIEFPRFLKKVDWPEMEKTWGHVRRGYTRDEVRELFGRYFSLVYMERGIANIGRVGLQLYFLRGWDRLWYRSRMARLFLKMFNYLDHWFCRNKGHCIFAVFDRLPCGAD